MQSNTNAGVYLHAVHTHTYTVYLYITVCANENTTVAEPLLMYVLNTGHNRSYLYTSTCEIHIQNYVYICTYVHIYITYVS